MFGDYKRGNFYKWKLHFSSLSFLQENVTFPFVSLKNENPFKVLALSAEWKFFYRGEISKFKEQKDFWGHKPEQSEDLCDDLLQSALVPQFVVQGSYL